MCFIKSRTKTPNVPNAVESAPVVRHQADASTTKTSMDGVNGYKENIKTSIIGLTDEAHTNKKTLLGE